MSSTMKQAEMKNTELLYHKTQRRSMNNRKVAFFYALKVKYWPSSRQRTNPLNLGECCY